MSKLVSPIPLEDRLGVITAHFHIKPESEVANPLFLLTPDVCPEPYSPLEANPIISCLLFVPQQTLLELTKPIDQYVYKRVLHQQELAADVMRSVTMAHLHTLRRIGLIPSGKGKDSPPKRRENPMNCQMVHNFWWIHQGCFENPNFPYLMNYETPQVPKLFLRVNIEHFVSLPERPFSRPDFPIEPPYSPGIFEPYDTTYRILDISTRSTVEDFAR